MQKHTLHSIAKQLQVSHTTVSRALRNHPKVSQKTRALVLKCVEENGYRPNRMARGLKANSMRIIGCVLPSVAEPFRSVVVDHLYRAAFQRGYMLQIVLSGFDLEEERRAVEECLATPVDGMVLFSSFPADLHFCSDARHPMFNLAATKFPVTLLQDGWKLRRRAFDGAVFDIKMAVYSATRHLIQQGCRDLRLLTTRTLFSLEFEKGEILSHSEGSREAGFRLALLEAELPFKPEWVVEYIGPFQKITKKVEFGNDRRIYSVEDGFIMLGQELAKKAMKLPASGPIGIVCTTDEIASIVRDVCLKKGLRVPEDVAITGCNDTMAPYISLTSYRWDYETYARQVLDHVISQIEGKKPSVLHPIAGYLHERDSTRRFAKI